MVGQREPKAQCQGLVSLLDQRGAVAGPSESGKEEWHRCASHLLDIAINCMHTDYNVKYLPCCFTAAFCFQ